MLLDQNYIPKKKKNIPKFQHILKNKEKRDLYRKISFFVCVCLCYVYDF